MSPLRSSRCILLLSLVLAATTWGDATAGPVADPDAAPYGFTGIVRTAYVRGSGSIVGSPYVLTTAAHVVYDEQRRTWEPSLDWEWTNGSENRSVWVRSLRYFRSYANAAALHGDNSQEAFAQDFAAGISYERLAADGRFGVLDPLAVNLLTGSLPKQIVGFPAGLYDRYDDARNRVHTTGSFSVSFRRKLGNYYGVSGVSLGPGGSGGGVWVQSGGTWRWVATYVSGLDKSLGEGRNSAGVVAAATDVKTLLEETWSMATPRAPQISSYTEVLNAQLGEDLFLQISYDAGFPGGIVRWYVRSPTGEITEASSYDDDGRQASLQVARERWHGHAFRAEVTNPEGTAATPWIDFAFTDLEAPRIVGQPAEWHVPLGQAGAFLVEAEGRPQPRFEWEIRRPDGGVETLRSHPCAWMDESSSLFEVPEGCLRLDNVEIRLRATNIAGEATSDWRTLTVESVPLETARYGELPGVLEIMEEVTVTVDLPPQTSLTWETRARHETEWQEGSSGWLYGTWSGDSCQILNQEWPPIHGFQFRAVVHRSVENVAHGMIRESFRLPAVSIEANGYPHVETPYADPARHWIITHYSRIPTTVAWQVYDSSAQVWRPVPEGVAQVSSTAEVSSMKVDGNTRGWGVRAVLDHPSQPDPWILDFSQSPDAAFAEDAEASLELSLPRYPWALAAHGRRMVFSDPEVAQQVWTYEVKDGELVPWGPALTGPLGVAGFGNFIALQGTTLAVASRGNHLNSATLLAGVYLYEEGDAQWQPAAFLPISESEAETVQRVEFVGDWLFVVEGPHGAMVPYLFGRDADGQWQRWQTLDGRGVVSEVDRAVRDFRLLPLGDDLVLSGTIDHDRCLLVKYRWEEASARFVIIDHVIVEELYLHSHAGRLWGGRDHPEAYLVSATWAEETGFQRASPTSVNTRPTADPFSHGLLFGQEMQSSSGPFISPNLKSLFLSRLGDDGALADPVIVRERRQSTDYKSDSYHRGLSDSHLFAIEYIRGGDFRLWAVPLDVALDWSPPVFTPWSEIRTAPERSAVEMRFRAPSAGHRLQQLHQSRDLTQWDPVSVPVRTLDPDVDGDGSTELRAFELPTEEGGVRFFRLEETAAP
ncbi:MAG: hypothetical protein ACLFU2_02735 [Opitutales bacterium]